MFWVNVLADLEKFGRNVLGGDNMYLERTTHSQKTRFLNPPPLDKATLWGQIFDVTASYTGL